MTEVGFSKRFIRAAKRLTKKYRHLDNDLQPLFVKLRNGETPGDQIPGVGYPVYKERVPNSDSQVGKSGGYRVIYYVQTATAVILLNIYSKTEQSDMPLEEIRQIIEEIDPPAEE